MTTPAIQPYHPSQRLALHALLTDCGLHQSAQDLARSTRMPWPMFTAAHGECLAGMVEGQYDASYPDGLAAISDKGPQAWIFKIYVHPQCRDAGIGTALLRRFAAEAESRGKTYLALQVDHQGDFNRRVRFFRRHGMDWLSEDDRLMGVRIGDVLT